MTPEQLVALGVAPDRAQVWAQPLAAAMGEFLIIGKRAQMFLATLLHESGNLTRTVENMNYSAQGLANTWARFSLTGKRGGAPNDLAWELARRPEAIANEVYANRGGNGSRESGDGWLYRGSGPGQLTFRNNFRAVGKRLGLDLEVNPEQVRQVPTVGALCAACHWYDAGLNDLADRGDFDKVSDVWNMGRETDRVGDSIGWQDRLAKLGIAAQVIV